MASYCKQCSLDTWGHDDEDFVGTHVLLLTLCEGCGVVHVDSKGKCLTDCLAHHGTYPQMTIEEWIKEGEKK